MQTRFLRNEGSVANEMIKKIVDCIYREFLNRILLVTPSMKTVLKAILVDEKHHKKPIVMLEMTEVY